MTEHHGHAKNERPGCRVRLEPGRIVEWNSKPYRLDVVGPTVCVLSAGRVSMNVPTSDLVAGIVMETPTSVDNVALVAAATGRTGWLRSPRLHRQHAVELSYRLNEVLTGHRFGAPGTGSPDERWEPYWRLSSLTQRSEQMASEICDDPESQSALGFEKITGRSLRRLANRFIEADYDPASLLDERMTALKDPSCGLTDEQRSVVDAQLVEQGESSDVGQRVLLSKIRIAFVQRHVTAPPDAKLRRYVTNARERHALNNNAKQRRNISARPDNPLHQVTTTHAGQFVEIDEWYIDMVGSVLGVPLHDLRLLVAIDVHTRAVLAIDVIVGAATIELVLSFLFRTITPVSHRLGSYPVPDDVHLPVPENLVAPLAELLDAKWHALPSPSIDTIVTDQGAQFRSRHVESALERMMISILPMPAGRPTGKPHVESFFNRLRQYLSALPGYTGGSPDKRGEAKHVDGGRLAPHEIQDLVIRFAMLYNSSEHQGLPMKPGTSHHMSPVEMLAQSSAQRGDVETLNPQVVPYWFLPCVEKNIRSQPFVHHHYRFDSPDLDDLRGTKQLVYYSRIDPTRVWMFHPGLKRWLKLRGRPTPKAIKRSQLLGEAAVVAALENTRWHTVSEQHDLGDALASAYALTPNLNDQQSRRRISEVWHRRHEKQLLEAAPEPVTSSEPLPPLDDWTHLVDDDDADWTVA